ncbi:hypothetical protein ATO10_07377 [Actibacterium atlanticum]|uniref:Uncharacterized protein n=1 Tax=Actibacterium atlanticum TaxID=1461693 RepID=A0A058ZLX8_9RHOB|nr:DUF6428 family protein [Actibacterium atlanticum]KCV82192.1 hypothetical protein ATO10_07377 [Actibacterium atlanticum]
MTHAPATLAQLLPLLEQAAADTPVIFATDSARIGPGYHVTELKLAQINSIDCGGNLNTWVETQLQLLDGADGAYLQAGKVASILRRSAQTIAGLSDAPLWVEMAPRNQGLSRYRIGAVQDTGGAFKVTLTHDQAQCKPAVSLGCCGTQAMESYCA